MILAAMVSLSAASAWSMTSGGERKGVGDREPAGTRAKGPDHPLDPLRAREVAQALDILRKSGKVTPTTMFPYLLLKEPPKQEVLAWKEGEPFRREAFVEMYDRKANTTAEAIIDLRAGKISDYKDIPGVQPSVMLSEFDAVPPIVKADPRFAEAMHRRGITNLDDIAIDIWAYGTPDDDLSKTTRLLRAIAYFKGKNKNFYAKPIDGWTAVVNMETRKIERVIDTEVLPIPPQSADFDEASLIKLAGGQRPPLKPLVISQPEGPSFTVVGNEVRWNNWSFHYAMHPREGLVLYLVKYNDHGTWRPVMYRGSLSDMMVPYGHNDQHWTYRAAFDEGEYGIGRYSGSLEVGTDVPANTRLFDALFVDDFGKPYVTKNAVGLWERDGGLLWKHMDMYAGGTYARRARELVIGFITTISNYDYGMNWVFHEDGTIEMEVVLSGIMLAKGSMVAKVEGHDHDNAPLDLLMGHLVAPNVVAPHHQHFFNFRLDLDVDGQENSVAELGNKAMPMGPDNPMGNAFTMGATPLKSELGAMRDLDFVSQRKWLVYNSGSRTESLGYPRGFAILPGENAAPYLQPDAPLLRRGGFVSHPIWFTQERDNEMHAAGEYPTQRVGGDGLPVWTQQDRSLEKQDVVMWYTFCVSHAPRPEEWPVMTVHKTGFQIVPVGFFDRNPGLDVRK
jgi:primary-amine oxidase